jgi:hypothetical protein
VSFNLEAFKLTDYNKLVTLTPVDADVTESFLKLVVLNGYVAMITQHADPMSLSILILGKMGVK